MSAPGRWLRLDVGTFESEWLVKLHPEAQHCWTRLLLHVKAVGTEGTAKRLGPSAIEALWRITPLRFAEMEDAAISDGALVIHDGWWVVTSWDKYQKPDRTNSLRQKRFREKTVTSLSGVMPRYRGVTRRATETLTLTDTSTPSVESDFQKAWDAYPKRAGSNPRKLALKAFQARVSEGVDPKTLIEATERYRRFVETSGKVGTEYVLQASTFFGPHERWKDEYHTNGNGNGTRPKLVNLGQLARDGRL